MAHLHTSPPCPAFSSLAAHRDTLGARLATVEMLEPLLDKIRAAPQLRCVTLEEVARFAQPSPFGPSALSLWLDGLLQAGFCDVCVCLLDAAAN